jgi:TPR repeat protein
VLCFPDYVPPSEVEEAAKQVDESQEVVHMYEAAARHLAVVTRRVARANAEDTRTSSSAAKLTWDGLPPGLQRDADSAVRLLEAAAVSHHKQAMFELGLLLADGADGKGPGGPASRAILTVDKTAAAEWFRKAATPSDESDGGHSEAATRLALAYWNGEGVPKSLATAAEWYDRAATAAALENDVESSSSSSPTVLEATVVSSENNRSDDAPLPPPPKPKATASDLYKKVAVRKAVGQTAPNKPGARSFSPLRARKVEAENTLPSKYYADTSEFDLEGEVNPYLKSNTGTSLDSVLDQVEVADFDAEEGSDTTAITFATVSKDPTAVAAAAAAERAASDARALAAAKKAADTLEATLELGHDETTVLTAAFQACVQSSAREKSTGISRKVFRKLVRQVVQNHPPSIMVNGDVIVGDASLLGGLKDSTLDDLFDVADADLSGTCDLDEFLDLYLEIKRALLRSALLNAAGDHSVTALGGVLDSELAHKTDSAVSTTHGSSAASPAGMLGAAASMFGFGAMATASQQSSKAAAGLSNFVQQAGKNLEAKEEMPRKNGKDAAAAASANNAPARHVTMHEDGITYDVSFPPLSVDPSTPLGFLVKETNKKWRWPLVSKLDGKGALRQRPLIGDAIVAVNGVEVGANPTDAEEWAARASLAKELHVDVEDVVLTGAMRKDYTAFDRTVRLIQEGRASESVPLVVTFRPPNFLEIPGFIEDESDNEASLSEDDDSISSELSDLDDDGNGRVKGKKGLISGTVNGDYELPCDYRDDLPPGHNEVNDEKEFFRKGDLVGWRSQDDDIPRGTVGVVVGFLEKGFVRVNFPKVGTCSFLPKDLKEPVWDPEQPWGENGVPPLEVDATEDPTSSSSWSMEEEEKKTEDEGEGTAAAPGVPTRPPSGSYAVTFYTEETHLKVMENADPRGPPVVSRAFPGSKHMKRGHLLTHINGTTLVHAERADHQPLTYALDLLALVEAPPVTFTFAKPPHTCDVKSVEGDPSSYDAVFTESDLGISLAAFGEARSVVRVVATHPIGLPHVGDKVTHVNGVSLLVLMENATRQAVHAGLGSARKIDPLSVVQRSIAESGRPLTLRMNHGNSSGGGDDAEDLTVAGGSSVASPSSSTSSSYSVLFMSQQLGITLNVSSGVPIVTRTAAVFRAPMVGDVVTAVNGADLSRLGVPVAELALMLQSLPRPLKLSFTPASKSLLGALKGSRRRIDSGMMLYPEHHLKQVMVPFGPKVGLNLATILGRPVVQAVTSPELIAQGVQPMDVLVSVGDVKLGTECTAARAAQVLAQAKHDAVHGTFRISLLRMAPRDAFSSYNSQHPVDVASALTHYNPETRVGKLSFSVPYALPFDKYKLLVFRYGSQVAPSTTTSIGGGGQSQRHAKASDQYMRITPHGKPHVLSYEELAASERLQEDDLAAERRLQKEAVGKEEEDLQHRIMAAKYEVALKAKALSSSSSSPVTNGPLGTIGEDNSDSGSGFGSDLGDSSDSD